MTFIAMKSSLLQTRALFMNFVETLMFMQNLQTLSRISPSSLIYIASSDSSNCMHKSNTYIQSSLDYPATLHGRWGTTDDFTTTVPRKKVKVSHSLIAVGAVGVRVLLYLGHS